MFVDTCGWASLLDADETHHGAARQRYTEAVSARHRLVTTNYVITELVTLLERPLRMPRPTAIRFIRGLMDSPHVDIVHITPELHARAWGLLCQRPDKTWSLVDCASFVVMEDLDITEALTTDHHFEQAGLTVLLR